MLHVNIRCSRQNALLYVLSQKVLYFEREREREKSTGEVLADDNSLDTLLVFWHMLVEEKNGHLSK